MAELRFLPFYADTLHQVLDRAGGRGGVDVTVRPDIDPQVVRRQVQLYAHGVGVQVRCRIEGGRVHVRCLPAGPPRHVERAG
jgi:hypothetical protein